MVETDKKEFAALVSGLCLAFDKEPTKTLLDVYWLGLQDDLDIEEMRIATKTALRQSKFMPRPVEIREFAKGSVDEQAIEAWSLVQRSQPLGAYRHVSFADGCINAAIRSLGGWPTMFELCASPEGEKWYRKLFMDAYKAFRNLGVSGKVCAPLAGLGEKQIINGEKSPPMITEIRKDGIFHPLRIADDRKREPVQAGRLLELKKV